MRMRSNTRKKEKRNLWLVAAVIWTIVIWSNSLRPATASVHQSMQVMEFLAPVLGPIFAVIGQAGTHTVLRKLAHMTEFAVGGLCWTLGLCRLGDRRASMDALGLCLCTALLDETIQLFVPGRGGMIPDVWIDLSGAVVAVILTSHVFRRWKQM